MSEFKKWLERPLKSGNDYSGFRKNDLGDLEVHCRTGVFLFETLQVCKAIRDDLGLASESALFAVYDRFIDRFNSMNPDSPYEQSMESWQLYLRLNKEAEEAIFSTSKNLVH